MIAMDENVPQNDAPRLRVTVVGLGYVGVTASVCVSRSGHRVHGVDLDAERAARLSAGELPFYEPELAELLRRELAGGRLTFSAVDAFDEATGDGLLGDVAMVCVGTPDRADGGADLSYVYSAVSWLAERAERSREDATLAMKSTVLPGMGRTLMSELLSGSRLGYAANPEFLRAGCAVVDWQRPKFIVAGAAHDPVAAARLRALYHDIDAPFHLTDLVTAETVKLVNNCYAATQISYINQAAALCAVAGADVDAVSDLLAHTTAHYRRLAPGIGYGGSCLPKDLDAALDYGARHGVDLSLLRSVREVNSRQRLRPVTEIRQWMGRYAAELKVAVLGLAFKPGTSDIRNSPSLDIARALAEAGGRVRAWDPQPLARSAARSALTDSGVAVVDTLPETVAEARAAVLCTEWDEIVNADWGQVAAAMSPPRVLYDGRRALNPERMRALGMRYCR